MGGCEAWAVSAGMYGLLIGAFVGGYMERHKERRAGMRAIRDLQDAHLEELARVHREAADQQLALGRALLAEADTRSAPPGGGEA